MNEHTAKAAFDAELCRTLVSGWSPRCGAALRSKLIADLRNGRACQSATSPSRLSAAIRARSARRESTPARQVQRDCEEPAIITIARRPADGGRPARNRRRSAHHERPRAHRRPCQEHRQAGRPRSNGDFHPQKLIRGVEHMADAGAVAAQGRAGRLRGPRRQPGALAVWQRRRPRSTRSARRCSANCSPT